MESSCVYDSHHSLPLFIQHLNICIKVFKAKCGDKIYMWVMVFLRLEYVSTNVAYLMDFSETRFTRLLKNTNKFWLKPAFYHFTIEFSTQETITTKTKHFVFFKIFVKKQKLKLLKLQHPTEKAIFLVEQKDWLEF